MLVPLSQILPALNLFGEKSNASQQMKPNPHKTVQIGTHLTTSLYEEDYVLTDEEHELTQSNTPFEQCSPDIKAERQRLWEEGGPDSLLE